VPTDPKAAPRPREPSPLRIALRPSVARRALGFAVIVGAVLVAINHGDALVSGEVGPVRWLKMGLTLLVPYVVSTVSSVMALRGMENR
jgi:hypothetical protein